MGQEPIRKISPMHFTSLPIRLTKRATARLFYGPLPPRHVIWNECPLNLPVLSLFRHHVTVRAAQRTNVLRPWRRFRWQCTQK